MKALALLKYNALALSAEDLKLGVGEALGLLDNSLGETTKIVVANVQPDPVYEKKFLTESCRLGRPGEAGDHFGDRPGNTPEAGRSRQGRHSYRRSSSRVTSWRPCLPSWMPRVIIRC